ncbi:MAG: lipoyl(octanoyl) transferase LipB [Planctomycetota bacterium]|jgi:lipoate-protein ligase B
MHLDERSICDLGLIPYAEGLTVQQEYARLREARQIADTLLLCEHPPVYTLGTNADVANVLRAGDIPVVQTDRGGEVTYHGPGQQVGYAICDLDARGRDLHKHCRDLEEVMIRVLDSFGLKGARIDGLTGVWIDDRKIGALGVRVRRWISSHGFALNVDCDLTPFEGIVPCGIRGASVTSIERELGSKVEVKEACACAFEEVFGAP